MAQEHLITYQRVSRSALVVEIEVLIDVLKKNQPEEHGYDSTKRQRVVASWVRQILP
ncbi:hypothetical protein Vi05172_g7320 [Venturia inaequalis]|nr:hypothetical protein Vi05172_g7320 [Venturia inaequalis]